MNFTTMKSFYLLSTSRNCGGVRPSKCIFPLISKTVWTSHNHFVYHENISLLRK